MSLLEGLLLEPPMPLWDVVVKEVDSISRISSTATVAASAHGYSNGEIIEIFGVTGSDANLWNGTFIIFESTADTFKYRMAGIPASTPATGTKKATRRRIKPYSEIYISDQGAEGPNGDGTIINPFNGASRRTPQLQITTNGLTSSGTVATAQTTVNHGFGVGDLVEVFGVSTANVENRYYMGVFAVTAVTSTTFQYQMAGDPPTSPAPASGTISCRRLSLKINSLSASNYVATATTEANHGFSWGDMVSITGADSHVVDQTVPPYGHPDTSLKYYNGTFRVLPHATDPKIFYYALWGIPTSSPIQPLAGKSIQCWKERERFDEVMRKISDFCVIHLAGHLETKGYAELNHGSGWWAKNGQRISGSGMNVTMLKLVTPSMSPYKVYAIASENDPTKLCDFFEVSDIGIDCNALGQFSPYVTCGGVTGTGVAKHTRIRRVRVINFSSTGPYGPPLLAYSELFTLNSGGDFPLIEGCVAENPAPAQRWNSTVLMIARNRGGIIRKNFVNEELTHGNSALIQSIAVAGSIWKITTRTPHELKVPGNVSVGGILVSGSLKNRFNGVFKIEAVLTDLEFTYAPFATNAALGEVSGNPYVASASKVGAPYSSEPVRILSGSAATNNKRFIVNTAREHNLTVNDKAFFGVIGVVDKNGTVLPVTDSENPCNGYFKIIAVTSKTQFEYETENFLPDPPDFVAPYTIGDVGAHCYVKAMSNILTAADMGTGSVVEQNVLMNGSTGGSWHDTADTKDIVVRNNFYNQTGSGPVQNLSWLYPALIAKTTSPGVTYANVGGKYIATFNTNLPITNLESEEIVEVRNVYVGGVPSTIYSGQFIVLSVTSSSFTYELSANPGANADLKSPTNTYPDYQKRARAGTLQYERNYWELAPGVLQGFWPQPSGIGVSSIVSIPYTFWNVLIRDNVIRQSDGKMDIWHGGITVYNARNLIIEGNVLDIGSTYPSNFDKTNPFYFLNQKSSGANVRGYKRDRTVSPQVITSYQGTIEDLIDEAFCIVI